MRTRQAITVALTGLAALATVSASAQEAGGRAPRRPASSYQGPAAYPSADKAAVAKTLAEALKIAGPDLFSDMAHRCIISPRYPQRVAGIQHDGLVEPTKIFDRFYSVGQNAVSSHALVTSAGIVLFDTLNSPDEAEHIIVPNLRKVGLDPKDIKYILITHGHGDHYGGARYLQKTYGARVISSAIDWEGMARAGAVASGPFAGLQPPDKDMVVADGETLKIGDTTLRFYITPGHTPGVVSTIFRVTDHGKPHTVGYFGGTGGGRAPDAIRAQITSLVRWRAITKAAGVDVLIANHPLHDRGIENNEILTSIPGVANPYVIGPDRYQRYMQVMEACSRVHLARFGQTD
jgi:metallo-beta-lactamase class B